MNKSNEVKWQPSAKNTNMSKSAKQGNIPQSNIVSKSELNRKSINLLNKNVIKISNYNIYK